MKKIQLHFPMNKGLTVTKQSLYFGQKYPKCLIKFQPNLSAQAQKFLIFEKSSLWVSVVRRLAFATLTQPMLRSYLDIQKIGKFFFFLEKVWSKISELHLKKVSFFVILHFHLFSQESDCIKKNCFPKNRPRFFWQMSSSQKVYWWPKLGTTQPVHKQSTIG